MNESDHTLVQQALRGDLASFDVLVRRHQGAVFGVAYHWTRSHAEAQDLAQETFITAFAVLGDLAQPEKFGAWVRGIAANHCRMWKRAHQRRETSLDAPGNETLNKALRDPQPTPLEDWERQERRQAVEEVLGLLHESQRLPAALYYVEGFSQREIGVALELPLSTIKMRLYRAKNTLREKEAVAMAERHFGKRGTSPRGDGKEATLDLQFKEGVGFFHAAKEGWGFLRPAFDAGKKPEDLYVSSSQRRMFNLIQGDYVQVTARPPKGPENYWAVVRMEQINFKPLVVPVSGYLHVCTEGFGFLRTEMGADAGPSDVYVSPQQVGDLGLEEGDFVEGVTFSRRQSRLAINRVNGQPVREPVSPQTLKVDGDFLRSGAGEKVVEGAREGAERLGHTYIGSEHLLLGLLQIQDSRARKILYELGIHAKTLGSAVAQYAPPRDEEQEPVDEGIKPFTPRARQLCAQAMVEAEELGFEPADAEHLLLALARDEAGAAAQILQAFGANYSIVRKELKALLAI